MVNTCDICEHFISFSNKKAINSDNDFPHPTINYLSWTLNEEIWATD